MKFRHFTTLHTDLGAADCLHLLSESIGPEERTVFSFSGYVGSKPVIGWIDGYHFYLHKRRHWPNSFAPLFYGNFLVVERGTTIEGYFDLRRDTKIFMRIFLAIVILFAVPFFGISLIEMIEKRSYSDGDLWFSLVQPIGFVLFAILLPRVGQFLGLHEERFIVEFLQNALSAKLTEPNPRID